MSTRRDFLRAGGALVVAFRLDAQGPPGAALQPGVPDMRQIDTWLAIHADNTATFYVGFCELGQGNSTALLQIAAEELDMDIGQLRTVNLETGATPNQGGTYSSASIARGGPQVRTAAAEARLALLKMASARLNAPVDELRVSKGVVTVVGDPKRLVIYGDLIGGKRFNLAFTGSAPTTPIADYKVAGASVPRKDTQAKVLGEYGYMQYMRRPNMVHGRVVRPRGQRAYGVGAKIVSVSVR